MIFMETVRAAHEELGRPTDDATLKQVADDANEAVCERSDVHFTRLLRQWQQQNGGATVIPGEVMGRCHGQSMRIAESEIMEEWFNEPIRALIDEKVARGEDGW